MAKKHMPKVLVVGGDRLVGDMFVKQGWQVVNHNAGQGRPDLVCFTGGADVDPALYGEPNVGSSINKARDEVEMKVFKEFDKAPKVGICRGGQFLNVMSGGKMWQDIKGHTRYHTAINLLTGTELYVSSTHHQMMRPGNGGEELMIATEASDHKNGNPNDNAVPNHDTEVVWYKDTNSLCFQPHPEYQTGDDDLVNAFFGMVDYFWKLRGTPVKG